MLSFGNILLLPKTLTPETVTQLEVNIKAAPQEPHLGVIPGKPYAMGSFLAFGPEAQTDVGFLRTIQDLNGKGSEEARQQAEYLQAARTAYIRQLGVNLERTAFPPTESPTASLKLISGHNKGNKGKDGA